MKLPERNSATMVYELHIALARMSFAEQYADRSKEILCLQCRTSTATGRQRWADRMAKQAELRTHSSEVPVARKENNAWQQPREASAAPQKQALHEAQLYGQGLTRLTSFKKTAPDPPAAPLNKKVLRLP